MRSKLGQVKGYGSAHHGTDHWIKQRLTAIFLAVFLIAHLVLFSSFLKEGGQLEYYTTSPFRLTLLVVTLITVIYHGLLGIKVVIEDYVHNLFTRNLLLITIYGFAFITIIAALLAVLTKSFSVN